MKILGLAFGYHDSSACILIDGKIIAAADEERFSRIKHDYNFPIRAIEFCLKEASITINDIDCVAYYENSYLKFDRIIETFIQSDETSYSFLSETFSNWIVNEKFDIDSKIKNKLNNQSLNIFKVGHHNSHAASAFFCSNFENATILTLDGVGEYETLTVSKGEGTSIKKIKSVMFPHSLGLFYSAFTAYLGFEVNEGEYKVMGLSAYGNPKYYQLIRSMISLTGDCGFEISQKYFNFSDLSKYPYSDEFAALFGPAREPESYFDLSVECQVNQPDVFAKNQKFADIASSVQKVIEEVILKLVEEAQLLTSCKDIVLAGGVALNSLANGKIQKINHEIYIQPAAGDGGNSLGAALYYYNNVCKFPRIKPLSNIYLGESWSNDQVAQILYEENIKNAIYFSDFNALSSYVAKLLLNANVVGWFQDKFEWGPRALGNRSILANPMIADMQRIVNEKIKYREPFRPFAPSVIFDKAEEYFEINRDLSPTAPEYFMLTVANVKETKKSLIPAVTHKDGTSRLQLVSQHSNTKYYNLIKDFEKISSVPILMNTSFNLRGEPMVASPYDALKTFMWSEMDFLVLGNYLIDKRRL